MECYVLSWDCTQFFLLWYSLFSPPVCSCLFCSLLSVSASFFFYQFLMVSICFCPFLYFSFHFVMFLYIFLRFRLFLSVFVCFCQFLSILLCFCPVLSFFICCFCFCLFLSIYVECEKCFLLKILHKLLTYEKLDISMTFTLEYNPLYLLFYKKVTIKSISLFILWQFFCLFLVSSCIFLSQNPTKIINNWFHLLKNKIYWWHSPRNTMLSIQKKSYYQHLRLFSDNCCLEKKEISISK